MNLAHPPRGARAAVVAACALLLVAGRADAASPARPHDHLRPGPVNPTVNTAVHSLVANDAGDGGGTDRDDPTAGFAQQNRMKAAPGITVGPGALVDARRQAGRLPALPTRWSEVTNVPLQPEDTRYADPVASNFGAGFGLNSGRVSSLAVDGHTVYEGAADGGLWRSDDDGRHWKPLSDHQQTLAMGALAVNPADHSLWIGTGEPSTSGDAYLGLGIYRSTDRGRTWKQVGRRMDGSVVSRITFDGQGHLYAATDEGVLRRDADDITSDWTVALAPGAPETRMSSAATDVAVRPDTGGRQVVAVIARMFYAKGDANGVYESDAFGKPGTWHKVTPAGDLADVVPGRSSLSYSADGHELFAVVGDATNGSDDGDVFRSATGDAAGPWTTVADEDVLKAAGAQNSEPTGAAWYNQYVAVDPADADHVYAAFSEVFESWDAGKTWATIGPYWNFGLPCYTQGLIAGGCPMTTHSDQHAIAFGPDHRVYFGNDGGVYERSATLHPDPLLPSKGWTNLNQDLRTLQYYDAAYGRDPATGALSTWGGTQDNGSVLGLPGARELYQPSGGDGGYVLVDPKNADRAVNEYIDLDMQLTTNGGRSDGTTPSYTNISPACAWNAKLDGCDPGPEFIAPYTSDVSDLNHWVAGGRYVWDNGGKGWDTRCTATSCDWRSVHDTGAKHSITALAVDGSVTYAGWEDWSGPQYASGIDTNAGGTWHRLTAPLPNRYVSSLTVDPHDADHVWATYGGFTESYVSGAGEGHVFESTDGGTTWTDRTGDLPDAPVGALTLWHGHVVVGTAVGVFAAVPAGHGGRTWYRLAGALPNAGIVSLDVSDDGGRLLVATHGRGLWSTGIW
ncbi:hypothetical protein [Streptomyces sp. S.PB5]|uniref:hypothetical protein n=1 Tax=Streptomyces sp. S.PB5 TaxID=3020844 RepID=UPI0025AFD2AC|nr:hypothetical protein [Streptomyces sp. S.PB5]MDN3029605.1 hypothetical protein [Streptomyces sp. S.PB5]